MVKSSAKAPNLEIGRRFPRPVGSDATAHPARCYAAEKIAGADCSAVPGFVGSYFEAFEGPGKAGLIHREKRGSFEFVRLNAAPMNEAEQWLSYYEKFWNQQLDALTEFFIETKKRASYAKQSWSYEPD